MTSLTSIDGSQKGSGDQCECIYWTSSKSPIACPFIWGQIETDSVHCLTTHTSSTSTSLLVEKCRMFSGFLAKCIWLGVDGIEWPEHFSLWSQWFSLPKEKFPYSMLKKEPHVNYQLMFGLVFIAKLRLFQTVPKLYIIFPRLHNKLPQIWWFKTIQMYSVTVLETRSRNQNDGWAMLLLKALEENSSLPLPSSGYFWYSLICGSRISICASIFMWLSSLSLDDFLSVMF